MLSVLCIDQDEALLAFLGDLLRKCGYITLSALTLDKGLRAMRFGKVDVVLLGLELPGTDWAEAVRRIRSCKPQTKIILYGEGGGNQDSMLEVADGVVSKPDIPALWSMLRALVIQQRSMN